MNKNFSILTWNVGGPSLERAKKQFQWLEKQPVDVLVLTECKNSYGCLFLERSFKNQNLCTIAENKVNNVIFPKPSGRRLSPSASNKKGVQLVWFNRQALRNRNNH